MRGNRAKGVTNLDRSYGILSGPLTQPKKTP
jgi:hypothetical protein